MASERVTSAIGPGRHGLTFSISMPGADSLAVALSRFATDVSDFRPFWEGPFKTLWYSGRAQAFALGGEPGMSTWAPLSEGYRAWKARRFPGAGPLVRSGRMKASLISPVAQGSIWRPDRRTLEIGSSVKSASGFNYPLAHQLGTRKMPARPPMAMSPATLLVTAKDLQKFVADAWRDRRRRGLGNS